MILSGDPIDAAEALRVGLVNRVVPRDELMPAARGARRADRHARAACGARRQARRP